LICVSLCWAACEAAEAPTPSRDRQEAASPTAKAALENTEHKWPGVDETVVEKVAREAGRPPREPIINTDHGDLLLFCFLVAGAIGGFILGYCFRALFPPRGRGKDEKAHV
jgi:ABC-type cobalt transport system substrate-binding protein